jgi:hypothetical protein
VAEIVADIQTVNAMAGELMAIAGAAQPGTSINDAVVVDYVQRHLKLFENRSAGPDIAARRWQCLSVVAGWLSSGGRTVFLQDGDSLIMPVDQLLEVLKSVRSSFPFVERITSYARARTVSHRTLSELKALREAGLSRLHLGMESGADEVLSRVQKGITAEVQIKAGHLVKQSGISLSEYVMPGLGGSLLSSKHAGESARVLNEVRPDFIRFRSLVLKPGMTLYGEMMDGSFSPASEDQMVDEIRLIIGTLQFPVRIASDHMSNLLGEVEGDLPGDRSRMLGIIDAYRAQPPAARQLFQLRRRLNSYLAVAGGADPALENETRQTFAAINAGQAMDENRLALLLSKLKQVYI